MRRSLLILAHVVILIKARMVTIPRSQTLRRVSSLIQTIASDLEMRSARHLSEQTNLLRFILLRSDLFVKSFGECPRDVGMSEVFPPTYAAAYYGHPTRRMTIILIDAVEEEKRFEGSSAAWEISKTHKHTQSRQPQCTKVFVEQLFCRLWRVAGAHRERN